jgi:DNA polymerase-3 subunit gamma/tau
MASENEDGIITTEQILSAALGKKLHMIAIPKSEWAKIREDFLHSEPTEEVTEVKEDPIIEEAIRLVGEQFVEIKE